MPGVLIPQVSWLSVPVCTKFYRKTDKTSYLKHLVELALRWYFLPYGPGLSLDIWVWPGFLILIASVCWVSGPCWSEWVNYNHNNNNQVLVPKNWGRLWILNMLINIKVGHMKRKTKKEIRKKIFKSILTW